MAKSSQLVVSLDARGFIRFVSESVVALNLSKFPFADIYADQLGKRVGVKLTKKEQAGSFRVLEQGGRFVLFVRGAMNEVGMSTKSGHLELVHEGDFLVLSRKSNKAAKTGEWVRVPCRNSPTIPMASLDQRGTLILDRNCTEAVGIPDSDTASVVFHAKKLELELEFQKKKGDLNVRPVGSHANLSLMGTFSSFGLRLPKKSVRFACKVSGKSLRFSVADLG